jgi:hypothetical protein
VISSDLQRESHSLGNPKVICLKDESYWGMKTNFLPPTVLVSRGNFLVFENFLKVIMHIKKRERKLEMWV